MNAMAAMRQYQNVSTQAQAIDASPHRLIQMLMEGGLTRMAQARGALERGEVALKGELIGKAIAIVGGLREGLDFEAGGEPGSQPRPPLRLHVDATDGSQLEERRGQARGSFRAVAQHQIRLGCDCPLRGIPRGTKQ